VWALKQFKELKANTQLIANDALEYFLLINDNTVLIQTALKICKRRLSLYQKKSEAIAQFQSILKNIGTGNRSGYYCV
jgi:formamidopyrimidine-DNA glycosylase